MEANNKLVTELSLDSNKFKSELNAAKASVSGFSDHARTLGVGLTTAFAAGAVAVTAFGVALLKQVEKIDEMANSAHRLNIGVQSFQSLSYAAQQSDVSIESMSTSITRLQKNVYAAQTGNKEAAKTFQELGLRVGDFKGMSPDDIFVKVSEAISGIKDPTKQAALAIELMGKGAIGSMNLIKSDIRGLQDEYRGLGVALSDSQVEAVAKLDDSRKTLGTMWDGFKNQVTADVAPAFDVLVESLTSVIKEGGGVKTVAAQMASAIVSGASAMILAFTDFMNLLMDVEDKLVSIGNKLGIPDIKDRLAMVGRAAGLALTEGTFTVDPNMIGSRGETANFASPKRPRYNTDAIQSKLLGTSAHLDKIAGGSDGPQSALSAMVTALGKSKEAVDKNTTALSNSGLKELFGVDGKEGANYIKSRLGASDTKQASSSDFDQVLQEIKESLSKGGGLSLNEQLQKLIQERENARTDASFDSLNQQIAGNTPGEISFSGMDAAIKNIENEINKLQGKGAPEVVVTLKVDEQGLIRAFVDGAPGSNAVKESARTLMREEAAGARS